jgi:PilZ domain-containing protein
MNRRRRRERRSDRRYPVAWKLEGKGISFLGLAQSPEEVVQGRIQDINRGGLRLLTKRPVEKSSVLQCEIFPSGLHIGIPTMMEVCWMQPNPEGPGMRVGLRFLI